MSVIGLVFQREHNDDGVGEEEDLSVANEGVDEEEDNDDGVGEEKDLSVMSD